MSYKLIREIGRGGYGDVWEASLPDGKTVALKRFLSRSDIERYLPKETEAMQRMDSGRIPKLVEVYDEAFSMELIDGLPLSQFSFERRDINASSIAAILEDVAEALVHAHERGVLHRDLKPHNVMVDMEDRGNLIDFGLSESIGEKVSEALVGTPGYAAPEIIFRRTEIIAPTFDVYSFGCTLGAAFAGNSPFRGFTGYRATMRNQETGTYSLSAAMPASLREIAAACIATDPAERPQTMREVLEMIQSARAEL